MSHEQIYDRDLMAMNGDRVTFFGQDVLGADTQKCIGIINGLLEEKGMRRLRKDTARIYAAIIGTFAETGPPMTVRQMFYALVSRGVVAKTETAYNRVGYHLLRMRRLGIVPYQFVADNTRWMRKPQTYAGLEQFLEITKQTYRRMLWADQPAYVEVWIEKDALTGVLDEVTAEWDVPLMVTRGFPSESFLYEAAEELTRQTWHKEAFVYYFGDHDPSGKSIAESTAGKLREFGAEFRFEMVAVTPEQIDRWSLPTRPTKKTDSRAKGWRGGSVELDAVPPPQLRQLCRECIEQHVDEGILDRTRMIEEAERNTLDELLQASPKLGRAE